MSKSVYKYQKENIKNIDENNKFTMEEMLYDTEKGLNIKFFLKKNDDRKKIMIKEMEADKFSIWITTNGEKEEKEVTMAKLKEFLTKDKNFAFALNYINNDMEKFRKSTGRKKTRSKRKGSKKKASKKKASKKKGSKKKASKKKGSKKKGSKRKGSKRK